MHSSSIDATDLPVLTPRTHCVLMSRDPHMIYAYWDYTQQDVNRLGSELIFRNEPPKYILRVYDVTAVNFDGTNANYTWDIEVGLETKKRFISVWQDNADYCVEFGVSTSGNQFVALMRSNTVHTAPLSPSKRDDLIWQDIKIQKDQTKIVSEPFLQAQQFYAGKKERRQKSPRIYSLSTDDMRRYYSKTFLRLARKGKSFENFFKGLTHGALWEKVNPVSIRHFEIWKLFHQGASEKAYTTTKKRMENLQGMPLGASEMYLGASEGYLGASEAYLGASEGQGRTSRRQFFFEVWTELIVHGRTEPDASVWLNQKGIKLNPDGTFSLRYALPDGEIPLKFIAQSSDGVEQRHILTGVERQRTIHFPKLLKEFHG